MRRGVAGVVIAMLVLTGCATETTGSGEPTTGRWTTSEAQQHYLDYVGQGNEDIDIVNRLVCTCVSEVDPQQLANACAAVADDDTTFVLHLTTAPWPEDATSAIDALAAVVKLQTKGYRSCASATSLADMRAREESIVSSTQQATEVRLILGLPPVRPASMAPRSVVSSPPVAD